MWDIREKEESTDNDLIFQTLDWYNTDITNEDLVVDFSCDGLALHVLDTDITNEIDFGVRLKHLAISLILQLHSLSLTRSSECHSRIICLRCK